uniref:HemC gene product n=1 Tax=Escherichia coli TaxID=562 RepID=Q47251_ECOLX|nr:unnamed protein product [Escherichia coli K-12]
RSSLKSITETPR